MLTATLTLRQDVKLCCKPVGCKDGSERYLDGELPAESTFRQLCDLLSSLQWDPQSVESVGPPLDSDGKIAVKKVYYALNETQGPASESGNSSKRRTFHAGGSFAEFAEWYSQVPANAVVSLKLWHETSSSAPSTPPSTPPRDLAQKATGMFRLLRAQRWIALLRRFGGLHCCVR